MGPRFSFVVHFSPTRLTDSRNGLQRKLLDDRFIRGRREAFHQMQLFAGSRNAVRFVKLVVSTISVFRNVLPSPLATNAGLRIARTPCVPGPPACTPAHGSACVHVPCAGLHAGEHACTSLVLTCTP